MFILTSERKVSVSVGFREFGVSTMQSPTINCIKINNRSLFYSDVSSVQCLYLNKTKHPLICCDSNYSAVFALRLQMRKTNKALEQIRSKTLEKQIQECQSFSECVIKSSLKSERRNKCTQCQQRKLSVSIEKQLLFNCVQQFSVGRQ